MATSATAQATADQPAAAELQWTPECIAFEFRSAGRSPGDRELGFNHWLAATVTCFSSVHELYLLTVDDQETAYNLRDVLNQVETESKTERRGGVIGKAPPWDF